MIINPLILFLSFFAFAFPVSPQQEARRLYEVKVDEIICDDAKSLLDNLSVELQNNPAAKAYFIFYGGRRIRGRLPRRGEAAARIYYWKPNMVNTRRIENSRVEVIDGGYRENLAAEMWIAPSGAKPPTPTPTLTEKDIRFRRGRITRIDICGED